MFNNWLNLHDLSRLMDKVLRGEWRGVLKNAGQDDEARIRSAWGHTEGRPMNAWEIPMLRRRWNHLVSGDEKVDHVEYITLRFLDGETALRAFSPCCGTGTNEMRWAATGRFSRIDACDLSAPRIAAARAAAEKNGLSGIVDFSMSDWRQTPMGAPYDLVIAEGALHHLYPMRSALASIHGMLKPGGLLLVNDFVGPTRFQWTPRQLQAANALLALIPKEYRRRWSDNRVKTRVDAPGRLRMKLADPSEAAESSLILPLLGEMFSTLELKNKGGALIPLVFHEIAHHYIRPDETAKEILRLCFATEDLLMGSGEIAGDYILGVFQKAMA